MIALLGNVDVLSRTVVCVLLAGNLLTVKYRVTSTSGDRDV